MSAFLQKFLQIAVACMAPCSAIAQSQGDLFKGPTNTLSIHPKSQNGALYGSRLQTATWHVSQWNNPSGDISDFVDGTARNDSLSVTVGSSSTAGLTIRQDGRLFACAPDVTPTEFDGLVGTNTSINNPGLPSSEGASLVGKTLSEYHTIVQRLTFSVVHAAFAQGAAGCPNAKAVVLTCVVLTDLQSRNTLFLQFILSAFNTVPRSSWWARGFHNGRYGYNLVLQSPAGGKISRFDMNILPHLTELIRGNNVGLDRDLSHWRISGAYFGSAVYGPVEITTTWNAYQLEGSTLAGVSLDPKHSRLK